MTKRNPKIQIRTPNPLNPAVAQVDNLTLEGNSTTPIRGYVATWESILINDDFYFSNGLLTSAMAFCVSIGIAFPPLLYLTTCLFVLFVLCASLACIYEPKLTYALVMRIIFILIGVAIGWR